MKSRKRAVYQELRKFRRVIAVRARFERAWAACASRVLGGAYFRDRIPRAECPSRERGCENKASSLVEGEENLGVSWYRQIPGGTN